MKSVFSSKYDKFRLRLVEARKTAGMTQVELAAKLNRPQSYVSKYERGERRLDVVEFFDVAQAMNVSPLEFLAELYGISRSRSRTRSS
jgi:transcriptional regulator with XRE-family HTH domain